MSRTSHALLFLVLALPAGCRAPLSVASLAPAQVEVQNRYDGTVSITTEGSKGSFLRKPLLRGEDLLAALTSAIESNQLFTAVRNDEQSDYTLDVRVLDLEEPEASLDMKADVSMQWRLAERQGGAVLWSEVLKTSFTATTYDETFMEERRGAAVQGAVRRNLERGLARISALTPEK